MYITNQSFWNGKWREEATFIPFRLLTVGQQRIPALREIALARVDTQQQFALGVDQTCQNFNGDS